MPCSADHTLIHVNILYRIVSYISDQSCDLETKV